MKRIITEPQSWPQCARSHLRTKLLLCLWPGSRCAQIYSFTPWLPVVHMLEPFSPSDVQSLLQSCQDDVNNKRGWRGESMAAVEEWNALMSSLLITGLTSVHSHRSNSSWRSLSSSLHFYCLITQMKINCGDSLHTCKLYKIYDSSWTLWKYDRPYLQWLYETGCASVSVCVLQAFKLVVEYLSVY